MVRAILAAATLAAAFVSTSANAAVVRVSKDAFLPAAGVITFSEFAGGTQNPTYAPGDYGALPTAPTVTFGGWFNGQGLSATPGADCPGGAASGCVTGTPTAGLSLDPNSPKTFITGDGANPTSPVLSGNPRFNGPIAILFSVDQFGVGFDAGFFNAAAGTAIQAFARNGTLLGQVVNQGTGIEFLGLVSGEADIAGVLLNLVGPEPAGYAIDNLRFGARGQVIDPEEPGVIPLPAGAWLMLSGLAALGIARRKSRKA